jgi:hypothetical protein
LKKAGLKVKILSFSYPESVKELAIQIIKESPNIPSEATFAINKKY